MIQDNYPHRLKGEEYHKVYLMTILKLAQSEPKLTVPILNIVLDKLISIDAEIKIRETQGIEGTCRT